MLQRLSITRGPPALIHHSSFIIPHYLSSSGRARYGQSLADVLVQEFESGENVGAEVNADAAPPAARERAEVAERLRLLQGAEGVGRAGYRQGFRVGRGGFEEEAPLRA